jgi:hypothetical protein
MVHGIDKHLVVALVCITFIVCKQSMKNMTHKQNIIVGIFFKTLKIYNLRIIQISQNKKCEKYHKNNDVLKIS